MEKGAAEHKRRANSFVRARVGRISSLKEAERKQTHNKEERERNLTEN